MRGYLYGLGLLLPLLGACSGSHVVAGEEKTKAEQLESALPTWCESICDRLRACPDSQSCVCDASGDACDCVGVDEQCESQCSAAFERFTNAGEACAAVGQGLQTCLDGLSCTELGKDDTCALNDDSDVCPDADQTSDSSSSGPNSGEDGGSSGDPGAAPTVDNPLVSCPDSWGTGGGMPAAGGSHVSCEEGRDSCSDGHEYSWICTVDTQGQRACSCLVDGVAAAGFAPAADCPELSEVNAGCGWMLLP